MRLRLIHALLMMGPIVLQASCEPKKGGGGSGGYLWSSEGVKSAEQSCQEVSSRETAINSSERCECALRESRKRWPYETFQQDPEGYLKEIFQDNAMHQCMGWRVQSFEKVDGSCKAEVTREFPAADDTSVRKSCTCVSENAASKWNYDDFAASYAAYYEVLKNEGVVSGCRAEAGLGKTWQNATILETSDSGNVAFPRLVMTSTGEALALWTQFDGVRPNQTTSRFRFNGGWSLAASLEIGNTGTSGYADIAVDKNGGAVAVWSRIGTSGGNIWAARYENGVWEGASLIEDANVSCPSNECSGGEWRTANVAVDVKGNAAAVWSVGAALWVNRFDTASKTWAGAEKLADNGRDADVAFDREGRAVFAWVDTAVSVRTWDAKAGWTDPITLESDSFASKPQIVFHESGSGILAWLSGTSRHSVMGSFYSSGGGWMAARALDEGKGDVAELTLSIDGQGLVFVAWQEKRDAREIMVTRTRDGTSWEPVLPLVPAAAGFSFAPKLASDGSGQTYLVFNRFNGKNWNVYHTTYDGKGWRFVEALPGFADKDRLEPVIAVDQTGQATIVFYQEDEPVRNLYGTVLR